MFVYQAEPTESQIYEVTTKHKGVTIKVRIHDCGNTAYEVASRHLTHYKYPIAAFILCYSVDDWASLSDLLLEWLHETAFYNFHRTPFVVVGCKKDTKEELTPEQQKKKRKVPPVGSEEGKHFAREMMARGFFECHTNQKKELDKVFDEVFKMGITEIERRVAAWVSQREAVVEAPKPAPTPLQQPASGFSVWNMLPDFMGTSESK